MARGDVVVFNEAWAILDGTAWVSTDDLKLAILDNTAAPTAATATPALGDFTQVGSGGNYVAGGTSLGTWGAFVAISGTTVTFDSTVNPTWAANASNDTDAYWGLIYNDTAAGDPAFAYVDLGGPVNMATSALTVTWNGSGVATLTNP